jgi:hypothetical protein
MATNSLAIQEDASHLINEALRLLTRARDLLKADVQHSVSSRFVGKDNVCHATQARTRLQISEEHRALLNDWIRLHCTQWNKYPRVHTSYKYTPQLMSGSFFGAVKAGHTEVCDWLLKTQKSRNVFHFFEHVAPDEDPLAVCKILKRHEFSANLHPVFTYVKAASRWAINKECIELLSLLKDWRFWDEPEILLKASEYGRLGILKSLKDTWGLSPTVAAANDNAALRAAVTNKRTEAAAFLTAWIFG